MSAARRVKGSVSIALVAEAAKEHAESYKMNVAVGAGVKDSCCSTARCTRCCCWPPWCCT